MRQKTRILIVDDSVVFRTFFRGCVEQLAHVEVVGIARDGRDAVQKIKTLKPDLVTLDMEMPHLNGIEVLECLQEEQPDVCVLVLSCETETDASRTVQALEAGAFDFIIKPKPGHTDPQGILLRLLKEKLPLARSVGEVTQLKGKPKPKQVSKPIVLKNKNAIVRPDVVAIGSSTGGPAALQKVLTALPKSFPVPVLVTQHMPKMFLVSLAERLNTEMNIRCELAQDGMQLKPGCVYLAPGDIHMKIERLGVKLHVCLQDGERVNHCKPAVDVTFHSLETLAPRVRTMAVVLTGMGADGAAGAKALADKGLHVIAQDEASSVVWGMPGATVRCGAASEVLALNDIAPALIKYCGGQ